jgi:signal transduction histidine kinase
VARALRGEVVPHFETVAWNRDGQTFSVECSAAPTHAKGAVTGAVLTVRDTRERQRMEEARRLARERGDEVQRLRAEDRSKTQFLNMAAHELNTPLTPILLQLELLRMTGRALTPEEQHRLEVLERNVSRLSGLVTDILDVARMQGGRLRLEPEALDLAVLTREAAESFQEPAARAGVELRVAADAPLPVRADPKRVMQVLFNLLDNAVKATPEGGVIAVDARVEGSAAHVAVRDTGRGFTAEEAVRLFQPFSQLESQPGAPPRQGSGLGLFICKGIVEQQSGQMGCTSAGTGKGATFWFRLPLAPAEAPQRPLAHEAAENAPEKAP